MCRRRGEVGQDRDAASHRKCRPRAGSAGRFGAAATCGGPSKVRTTDVQASTRTTKSKAVARRKYSSFVGKGGRLQDSTTRVQVSSYFRRIAVHAPSALVRIRFQAPAWCLRRPRLAKAGGDRYVTKMVYCCSIQIYGLRIILSHSVLMLTAQLPAADVIWCLAKRLSSALLQRAGEEHIDRAALEDRPIGYGTLSCYARAI